VFVVCCREVRVVFEVRREDEAEVYKAEGDQIEICKAECRKVEGCKAEVEVEWKS
jgi:hypothetical protein